MTGMAASLERYDDFRVLGRDLSDRPGFTLTSVVRDEMFFLPAFLEHYRAIGVGRFVFLDDRSADGTREFLLEQPDCMVLESGRRYGDIVALDHPIARRVWERKGGRRLPDGRVRLAHVWRNLLIRRYAGMSWTVQADADEFLRLPEGMTLQDMAARLEASGRTAAWSVMLDLYPARFHDLAAMRGEPVLDRSRAWYFDARSHVRLRGSDRPQMRHAGSRARLMHRFGVHRTSRLRRWRDPGSWVALLRGLTTIPRYNEILKMMLFRLPAGGWFRTVHDPAFQIRTDCLLPFEHYKFCGDLFRRVPDAIATGAWAGDSVRYVRYAPSASHHGAEGCVVPLPVFRAGRRFRRLCCLRRRRGRFRGGVLTARALSCSRSAAMTAVSPQPSCGGARRAVPAALREGLRACGASNAARRGTAR